MCTDLCKGNPGPVRAMVYITIPHVLQTLIYISAGNIDAAIVTGICINYSALMIRLQRDSQIIKLINIWKALQCWEPLSGA